MTNKALLWTVILSTALCPVERMLMGRDFGVNIVTFVQVTALFLLGLKNPGFGKGKLLNRLGAAYSMYIYIIHPAVLHLLDKLYAGLRLKESIAALYVRPILCLAITIACAIVFLSVKQLIAEKTLPRKT